MNQHGQKPQKTTRRHGKNPPRNFSTKNQTAEQKQLQKLNQEIKKLENQKFRMQVKQEQISSGLRRKRTRTLIQLGGLIEKSGILENLGIEIGSDIQNDEEIQEKVAELYGNILHIKKDMKDEDYSPTLFIQIGKKELSR